MFIAFSCALIGHRRNNVRDLIGAKTTKRKECCSNVSSRLWGGALRDDTKNGCKGDYVQQDAPNGISRDAKCDLIYSHCMLRRFLKLSNKTANF